MKPRSLFAITYAFIAITAFNLDADDRPNIVFLLADDQCTYSMGCYGTPSVQTPVLDRLAHDGIVFDNHYDTTAICMASRVNIMTGMFEYKSGCNFEHGPLLSKHWEKSYPMLLRESGYTTGFAGKFGFTVSEEPKQRGGRENSTLPESDFDWWGGGPGQTSYETKKNKSMLKYAREFPHATRSYGAFGRDFVSKFAKSDQPYCLSISFKAPHMPATPDPVFDSVYQGVTFTKPANYGRQYGTHFSLQSRQGRQYERFHSWHYSDDYDRVMATYYQQIHAVDFAVGMIREAIEESGEADNTVIIYTSDNGFMCGSHGYGSKVLPYEESTRVPLIIYDPRHVNSGKQLRTKALTGNVDFAPTILDLAGLPTPPTMDGRSLMSVYGDPNDTEIHSWLPLINVWGPAPCHSLSVVTKDWKYIYWPYSDADMKPTDELYYTAKDPLELSNLAGNESNRADLQRLREVYQIAVTHWKENAVPYHNYQPFGQLFDRNRK